MLAGLLSLWPIFKEVLKGTGIIRDPAEEQAFKIKMLELAQREEEYFSRALESVNATMRAEAASEHWLQWGWRPIVGLTFAATIVNNYILMPYFPNLHPISIPSEVWNAMLMVLGVAAATRGWQKIEQVRRNGNDSISPKSPQKVSGQNAVPRPAVDDPDDVLARRREESTERWRRIDALTEEANRIGGHPGEERPER